MKDDQRIALTKRLLREGLFRLLENKEIDQINVTELCKESGINRATFYRHYEQPRDILSELRFSFVKEVEISAEKSKPEKNLLKWLENICQYFYDNSDMLRMLFKTRTDDEFIEIIRKLCNEHYSFTGKPDDDYIKLQTYFFAGGFYYILRQWISEPIDKTPSEVATVIYAFIRGISSGRGVID